MKNMQQFMKQAQEMQKRIEDAQAQLGEMTMEGKSGGGMVTVTITGKGMMQNVNIDKSLLDPEEKEVLEDLIVAAFNDAKGQMEKEFSDRMADITGGALPPGFKMPGQ